MRPGQRPVVLGDVMIAAEKQASKNLERPLEKPAKRFSSELFDDVPVLQRKWRAAVRPGDRLPRYEDVMLGSLGRLADHIVLLKGKAEALEV